jgi:hypothetical protein
MSDLPDKIHSLTKDLRNLQREFQTPAVQTHRAELDSAALKQFKDSIDYMRQLLWVYLQAASQKHGENVEEEVRSLRLQRVTEMLHSIQQEVEVKQLTQTPEAVSFLKAVHEIADAALQRHFGADPDVEKAS